MKRLEEIETKAHRIFKVENTDYFVEIVDKIEDGELWIEVWLQKENYGIKTYMFGIQKTCDFRDVIEQNIDSYIEDYESEYV